METQFIARGWRKRRRPRPPARNGRPKDDSLAWLLPEGEQIEADVFGSEQLRRHARALGESHQVIDKSQGDKLLRRLADNAEMLERAYSRLEDAAASGHSLPKGSEWLLDSFYLVRRQIRMARQHLPKEYSKELPAISSDTASKDGLPRVYDLACELIRHVAGQIDQADLETFVADYQSVTDLTLGELWAIPIMLRMALIENIRRTAVRLAWRQHQGQLAAEWARQIADASRQSLSSLVHTLGRLLSAGLPSNGPFAARFAEQLEGQLPHDDVALQLIQQLLQSSGVSPGRLVDTDSQSEAADQISIANSITSLRSLDAIDWQRFVEKQSAVDKELTKDPAGFYSQMDFDSRDFYRHAVERLARRCTLSQRDVARAAVAEARQAADSLRTPSSSPRKTFAPSARLSDGGLRERHVGFYLLGAGRRRLERAIQYRRTWAERLAGGLGRVPMLCYLGAVTTVWLSVIAVAITVGRMAEFGGTLAVAIAMVAAFAAASSQFAVSTINWLVMLLVPPRPVMRLDFSEGLAPECKTLVAVPCMLTGRATVRSLVERLEVCYLANRDEHLRFALLTDFRDADSQAVPGDAALLNLAVGEINRLNAKYRGHGPPPFLLLHRGRSWNAREGVWMGRERKRGKLTDLNRLLIAGDRTPFSTIVGDATGLMNVRYVITLDSDTSLPADAARKLVGCMAHPLNRPEIDPHTATVVRGYGVLQPRVTTAVPAANASLYSRLFGGDAGIDTYTRLSSNAYQDLFGEGAFVGKGIYDVHAFDAVLANRFPESRVLSHDLIEGCFARSGLVTDVDLFENFPTGLLADMKRRHRWIRGDWQIAAWLGPQVPHGKGSAPNPLSLLGRWKIFDNLRRSLHPIALLTFLVVGWILMPGDAALITAACLVLVFSPVLICRLSRWKRQRGERLCLPRLSRWWSAVAKGLACESIDLAVLPHTVHWNLDAIIRVVDRLCRTRRKLLEWTTSDDVESRMETSCRGHYQWMWSCPVTALGLAALLLSVDPTALVGAAPLLALWFAGPAIAWRVSQRSPRRDDLGLPDACRDDLRRWARFSWHYFETFSGDGLGGLFPDNVQWRPLKAVATRTSPTDLGMGLLATLSALDLGYLTKTDFLTRCDSVLGTMLGLERYRGHLYNWYDSVTLRPLEPRYVSSVDSGNLGGALVLLHAGLEELRTAPLFSSQLRQGLCDTLAVLEHNAAGNAAVLEVLRAARQECRPAARATTPGGREPTDPPGARQLDALVRRLKTYVDRCPALDESQEAASNWLGVLGRQLDAVSGELDELAFWVALPAFGRPEGIVDAVGYARLDEIRMILASFDECVTLTSLSTAGDRVVWLAGDLISRLTAGNGHVRGGAARRKLAGELAELESRARQAAVAARGHLRRIDELTGDCNSLGEMDYTFLYDTRRRLLATGYNVTELRRDESRYDLLASEARLASFLAISRGQLPEEHWFALGRTLANGDHEPTLLSWSGSMFEYLLPMLFLPSYERTLLDESCRSAVRRQIAYGRRRGVPWGISESCWNVTSVDSAYQYHSFGIPGLAFERVTADTLVVAPYATALALLVCGREAWANLRRLEALGCLSQYGFFDAVDFTPSHRDEIDRPAVCKTVMAHHTGMSLVAMAAVLGAYSPERRFLSDPRCRAYVPLLHERIPRDAPPTDLEILEHAESRPTGAENGNGEDAAMPNPNQTTEASFVRLRVFDSPHTSYPEVHSLSNESYQVLLSAAGGGWSRWRETVLTRWRADTTRDCWGQFIYLRDPQSGSYWSNTYQPTCREADKYQAIFSQGHVEYRSVMHGFDVRTQVVVPPDADVEIRRISVTNLRRTPRPLELTTYAEVVLASQDADQSHPAFGKLFVEVEVVPDKSAILCRRRPAHPDQAELWMFHTLTPPGAGQSPATFETSRERFLGRHRTAERPQAMETPGPLTGDARLSLDPIVSIRRNVDIAAEQALVLDVITGVADSREAALALVEKFHDRRLVARAFEMARTHSQLMLQHLEIDEADAQLYASLTGALLYHDPRHRADPERIARLLDRQDHLWPLSIGGDLPIVLVRVEQQRDISVAEQMAAAHAYWRRKAIRADLVIAVRDVGGAHHQLREQVLQRINTARSAAMLDQPGGIRVLSVDQCTEEQWSLLEAVAAIALTEGGGSVEQRLQWKQRARPSEPPLHAARLRPVATRERGRTQASQETQRCPTRDLIFFNGLGGFTPDGKEYIVTLGPGDTTPTPWSNVIANPHFGTLVTEAGLGCTWAGNSQLFRLTPWSNDPVCDPPGEAVYLRDEDSGRWISATPRPGDANRAWTCRHGFGYTVWQGEAMDLATELWTYVSVDQPVKFVVLTVRNRSSRPRRLSAYYYLEWVLGGCRDKTQPHLITQIDPQSGALFARNRFHSDYSENVAFLQSSRPAAGVTCDRGEFLGRNGSPDAPASLGRSGLEGRSGAGWDAIAAMQCPLEIGPGQKTDLVFVLGAGGSEAKARRLAARFASVPAAGAERSRVWEQWNELLGGVFVQTPDPALDILANGWLRYQTIACRLWGRTAFYQSSGACGFRDQLQDVMSLTATAPWLTREHLLRAAARQFREGDVQHWWHPDTGRGIRTRIADDLLWLPLAVAQYVSVTGDTGILDEQVPLLIERPLAAGETSRFSQPAPTAEAVDLYEHCRLALRHGARLGKHGLMLFGAGDWNDGMDRVGIEGKGESVWLSFFMAYVLQQFADVARLRADSACAAWCEQQREELGRHLDRHAWAGHWYLRGFFDDGRPLGSPDGEECQITSLPQSWAVMSRAGLPERAEEAIEHARQRLVRREHGLVQLFDPPLDVSRPHAGYIQAYLPGVRENGGQYTHAAIWLARGLAELGEAAKAWECFSLLNPIERARSPQDVATYRLEPYVASADVCMARGHAGRGGWSWYTGSAGWMNRLILEDILGISIVGGNRLRLRPSPPPHWKQYRVYYRFHHTHYEIEVRLEGRDEPKDAADAAADAAADMTAEAAAGRSYRVATVVLDERPQDGPEITLVDDGGHHRVFVTLV